MKRMTKQSRDSSDVDWDERRLDWLAELEDLYRRMEQHLKPYTDKNEIQIERDVIRLSEDYLGTYDATKLTFRIGHEKISANPKGTLLIGARGRVDLSGSRKLVEDRVVRRRRTVSYNQNRQCVHSEGIKSITSARREQSRLVHCINSFEKSVFRFW